MKKLTLCSLLFSACAFAQTADIAFFRAVMLPSNEVPVVNANVSGVADIIAHVIRDGNGQITSGTVQFLIRTNFAADNTAVGLHIHSGAAGVAGPVVIPTSLSAGNPQPIKAGGDVVALPADVTGDGPSLTALRGLFADPTQYYVNIHTTDFTGGIMRGQLRRAVGAMSMGLMSSANEVPVNTADASGVATVVAIATFDDKGALETGETYFYTTYNISDGGTFNGFHIHPGAAGATGPAALPAALPAGTTVDPAGGHLGPFYTEIVLSNAPMVQTFLNLFSNPSADYINVHTSPAHTGGAMRAQLRNAEQVIFPVTMDSANELGPITAKEKAPAQVVLRVIRNEDGTVAGGFVFFDINYRFAGSTNITGLHIHDGTAAANGPISIPMIPTTDPIFTTTTGFGNYFGQTPPVAGFGTLEDILKNPENHYVNIHTSTDPGGAARAQLAAPVNTPAQINAVISGNNDKNATTIAPGELISIYGNRLSKVTGDLSGWAGKVIPFALNGTSVTIGGKTAGLLYVSPSQIVAQVPLDVDLGQQTVTVNNGVGPSTTFAASVAAFAPAVFNTSPDTAAVVKNSDFSLVSASNPVKAGEAIVVYMTGLGQTTPAITTGGIVTGLPKTSAVTATIGARDAEVIYSIAAPGYAGLNQVALTVPAGVTGSVPLVISQGTTKANTVNINVQ
jgi:uncharacterized protein (TIGR03437 family)